MKDVVRIYQKKELKIIFKIYILQICSLYSWWKGVFLLNTKFFNTKEIFPIIGSFLVETFHFSQFCGVFHFFHNLFDFIDFIDFSKFSIPVPLSHINFESGNFCRIVPRNLLFIELCKVEIDDPQFAKFSR